MSVVYTKPDCDFQVGDTVSARINPPHQGFSGVVTGLYKNWVYVWVNGGRAVKLDRAWLTKEPK